jgi:DNA-binding SARP family transcriptional activator
MAVELTGRRRAADVIELLHRASYFTNKRPGMNGAYEYHPLFRQFLMAEARRAYSSPRLAALRSRAAHLVEQAGDLAAAVELLADAENWEAVAQLICRHAPSLLAQGRVHTIEQWLARMPEEAFTETAWLLCWRGVCQLGRGHDSCRRDCEQALAAFRRDRDTDGMLLSWAIVVMSHLMEGWLEPLDDWIPRLAELQSESSHPAAPQIEARVATTMLIAIAFRQPTHPNGAQWAQRALDLTRAESDLGLRCLAASGWFLYHWMRGETATASLVVDEMRTLSRRRDVPSVVSLQAAIPVIWYELFHGSPDCRQTVADIREHARATGLRHALLTTALAYGAFSALSDGQHEVASAWIRELERESPNLGPAYAFAYYGLIAVEALARNDVERASAYVDKLARRGYTAGNPVEEVFAHTVTAYVCSRRGEDETASAHAARALEVALAQGLRFAEWWARIAAAHVSFASGAEGEGLQALALAMKIGKTCGYVNSQVWVPTIMMPLLARALDAGIEVEYVRDLIRRRRLVCDPPPLDIEAWPWPIKIVTLGRFAVMKDDRPLRSGGKVQRKPLALLTMLAAHGAAGVHEQRVQDALWPDADGDAARRALTTAVFRLRRLLGNETAVVRRDGRIGLSAARCWVDVWAMERLLERAERANTRGDPEGGAQLAERAAALYGGPVVGPNDDDMPTDPRSDRLRRRLIRQLVTAGRRYETTGQWHRAENVFEAALKLDPSDEGVRASLTLAYRRLGRPAV